MRSHLTFSLLLVGFSNAWMTPLISKNSPLQRLPAKLRTDTKLEVSTLPQSTTSDRVEKCSSVCSDPIEDITTPSASVTKMGATAGTCIGMAAMTGSPEIASAEGVTMAATLSSSMITAGGSVKSALFAYGHYIAILAVVGILMTERWTLENGPNLTDDQENRLAIADTLYGVFGILLVYTGYYRLSDPTLGKGTDFYIHEPIFWLKIAMVGVMGASSFFNTTKIIQRSVARNTGDKTVEPMSEALCERMKSICNAQLTAIVFIPLAATFMARGIGYNDSIPWQAEAAVSALIFLGLGFKYINEALTFETKLQETSE